MKIKELVMIGLMLAIFKLIINKLLIKKHFFTVNIYIINKIINKTI